MKNATQNITVLKPRPSWNSLPIGASPAFSSGSAKRSSACGRYAGSSRLSTCLTSSRRPARIRKGIDSGSDFITIGISSTGSPAAINTDCQP